MKPELSDEGVDMPGMTEDELCALALGTEAGRPPADDAVPLADYLDAQRVGAGGGSGGSGGLLPTWYMPAPMTRVSPKWRTPVVLAIVAAFLSIEAAGLCSTFGQIVPA
jgi:hypothetical protein